VGAEISAPSTFKISKNGFKICNKFAYILNIIFILPYKIWQNEKKAVPLQPYYYAFTKTLINKYDEKIDDGRSPCLCMFGRYGTELESES
jgi:hypothetical protein